MHSNHHQSSLIHCNLSHVPFTSNMAAWLFEPSGSPTAGHTKGTCSRVSPFAHFCIQGTETFSRKQSNWKSVKSSGASQSKFHGHAIVVIVMVKKSNETTLEHKKTEKFTAQENKAQESKHQAYSHLTSHISAPLSDSPQIHEIYVPVAHCGLPSQRPIHCTHVFATPQGSPR